MNAFVRLVQRGAERKLRVPADYIGRMGETSFSGFLKFLGFLPVAGHRRKADKAVAHAVKVVATQHEDCGPCVQIAVNAALDEGVEPQMIRALLKRDHDELPSDVSLAVRFAEGVLANDGSEDAPRRQIESRLGSTVLTELCLGIATARVFPTIKRGMGFAKSCSLIDIEVEPLRRS